MSWPFPWYVILWLVCCGVMIGFVIVVGHTSCANLHGSWRVECLYCSPYVHPPGLVTTMVSGTFAIFRLHRTC